MVDDGASLEGLAVMEDDIVRDTSDGVGAFEGDIVALCVAEFFDGVITLENVSPVRVEDAVGGEDGVADVLTDVDDDADGDKVASEDSVAVAELVRPSCDGDIDRVDELSLETDGEKVGDTDTVAAKDGELDGVPPVRLGVRVDDKTADSEGDGVVVRDADWLEDSPVHETSFVKLAVAEPAESVPVRVGDGVFPLRDRDTSLLGVAADGDMEADKLADTDSTVDGVAETDGVADVVDDPTVKERDILLVCVCDGVGFVDDRSMLSDEDNVVL